CGLLVRVVVASFVMFFAAHALLFRLHLPSRYTQHSLRIVLALSAGFVLLILLDSLARWLRTRRLRLARLRPRLPGLIAAGLLGLVLLGSIVDPVARGIFPKTQYWTGHEPGLYQYLQLQPSNALIATLSVQSDLLPSLARRSVLTGYEYGIPYHLGYY